ncbi:hypothetical protein DN475_33870 [Burkholderia multivorans]|nr:hypothetical protein DN475_33870 [Burkholderia multivorans]
MLAQGQLLAQTSHQMAWMSQVFLLFQLYFEPVLVVERYQLVVLFLSYSSLFLAYLFVSLVSV